MNEAQLVARMNRRHANEARMFDKYNKLYDKAEQMIGELMIEGVTVFYINLRNSAGRPTGRIKKGGFGELCGYLIRNRYV